jgi:hypothetical protein
MSTQIVQKSWRVTGIMRALCEGGDAPVRWPAGLPRHAAEREERVLFDDYRNVVDVDAEMVVNVDDADDAPIIDEDDGARVAGRGFDVDAAEVNDVAHSAVVVQQAEQRARHAERARDAEEARIRVAEGRARVVAVAAAQVAAATMGGRAVLPGPAPAVPQAPAAPAAPAAVGGVGGRGGGGGRGGRGGAQAARPVGGTGRGAAAAARGANIARNEGAWEAFRSQGRAESQRSESQARAASQAHSQAGGLADRDGFLLPQ